MSARLTRFLLAHARLVMPPNRAIWAQAMQQEAASIGEGKAALSWALGCVTASYGERLKAEYLFLPLLVRLYLMLVCLKYGLGALNTVVAATECQMLGASHPLTLPLAQFIFPWGSFYPTFTFGRLPPCGNWNWGVPTIVKASWLMAAGLYFFTALQLAQNRASAFPAFACALLSGLLSFALTASIGYHYFNDHSWYWSLPGIRPDRYRQATRVGVLYPLLAGIGIGLVVLLRPKTRKTPD